MGRWEWAHGEVQTPRFGKGYVSRSFFVLRSGAFSDPRCLLEARKCRCNAPKGQKRSARQWPKPVPTRLRTNRAFASPPFRPDLLGLGAGGERSAIHGFQCQDLRQRGVAAPARPLLRLGSACSRVPKRDGRICGWMAFMLIKPGVYINPGRHSGCKGWGCWVIIQGMVVDSG